MPTDILYDVKDRVATLKLNRPDKLNAWTRAMEQDVREAMRDAAADDSVRVIVLTGAGRGFCAGADMSLLNEVVQRRPNASEVRDTFVPNGGNATDPAVRPDFQQKYSYFPAIPKPIIGAVN